jgi:hypothetical protein
VKKMNRHLPALFCLLAVGSATAELTSHTDDKGITFTTRNNKRTKLASGTDSSGKIAASLYFEGYLVATIIGWTEEAVATKPEKCLFQRRMLSGRTSSNKSLGISYAFIKKANEQEIFHISQWGEIIDAYYVSKRNELSPLSDEEFESYKEERNRPPEK